MISSRQSPIDDPELALFLKEELLDISATLDFKAAVSGSGFVVIAAPTDYDDATNQFDTSSVRSVAEKVRNLDPSATIFVKSTIPIGLSMNCERIWIFRTSFSHEFLREGRAHTIIFSQGIIVGGYSDR